MSDLYLNGFIYGNKYSTDSFVGSVYKGNIFGKLNNVILNDGSKIDSTVKEYDTKQLLYSINGKFDCTCVSYNTTNITKCSIVGELDGIIKEVSPQEYNIVGSIINDINNYIKDYGSITLGTNYGTFIITLDNKTTTVKLINEIGKNNYKIQHDNTVISLFMSTYYIYITIDDRNWLLPSSDDYSVYYIMNCKIINDTLENKTEYNNNVVYNRVNTELINLYNEMLPNNINKSMPTQKESYNNLFNRYYVRYPGVNEYLNINIGLSSGVVKLIDNNDNNYVSIHVFNNPELNVLGKSTDHNPYTIEYINKDSDEAKAYTFNERTTNYEKYNRYISKLDLIDIEPDKLIDYIMLLKRMYKLDIMLDDDNKIAAVYIVSRLQ